MRITIVQTEIEEAIRNHILSQISVQDGMEIDIDLRATRGAEGFQADIDIHPVRENEPVVEAEVAPVKQEAVSEPLAIKATVTKAKRAPRKAVEPVAEPQPEPEVVAEEPTETQPEAEAPAAEEAPVEEAPAKPPLSIFSKKPEVAATADVPSNDDQVTGTGQTQSIFGGLKRPVNA